MSEPADASDAVFWGDADDGEARRRYRSLVNSLGEGVYRLDGERRFVAVNDAFVELSGYDREELRGEHVSALFGDDGAAIGDAIERRGTTGTGASDALDCTLQRADGTAVGCTVRIDVTDAADGAAGAVCVVRRSVDDGRAAEATGERRRPAGRERDLERYETIVETINDGVYVVDETGRFTTVNRAYTEMLGYDREELLGEHVSLVVDDEVMALAQQTEAAMVDGEMDGPMIEAEMKTADGGRLPAEATFAMLPDVDGEARRVGVVRDISERKRALRRLEQERDMFAQGPAVVFRWKNEEGWPVEHVSDNVAEIFGYDPAVLESGDVPYTDLLLDEELDRIAAEVEANSDGETERFSHEPYRIRTSDGDVRWVTDTTKVVRDETGEITHFLGYLVDITDRKERERELTKYETIVETMNDGIYVKDADGYFTMVNEAYAALTGYDREELLGEHASIVVDEAAIERSRERQADAVDDLANSAMEAILQTADGGEVPTEGTFTTLETDDGERNEVGVVRDITERKEQRRRIEESERRYRTLVENFPNGAVGMFDEDLEYTVVGGDILEDVDTSAEEVVGKTVWDRYPDELAAQLEPNFRAAIEEGETSEFEMEFHDRHWMAYTVPIRDSEGDAFAGMILVQDVTDRIRREQALEESKNQLQALIELLPVAVFVAEADGEIVEWNEAAEEIWGGEVVESDSVAEYDQYDGWWADTGEPVEPDEWALARVLEGKEVTDPDVIEIEGFDGERRTVLNHGMPVRNADGEVARAVVTLTDITERNEYQRKLEASNERLEQFAYAASHDLQEPLRMVSSYLRLIEQRYAADLDEDGEEFIEFAVDGADRMRDMIEGLLQYSRVDTGGGSFEPVDLASVLDDVREDLQVTLDESDAEITVAELPVVEGDGGQLRQVFQNLLDNAVEYSGDEPPRVEVDAERAGDEWHVSVSDAGIGIDPDDADRVFEVFQSLHAPDDHSGTGIGLALCERIVERHGGEIWVDSEPGEGSTFTFTLPAAGESDA